MYPLHKISASMLMGFGSHSGALFPTNWDADSSAFIHSRFRSRFLINLSFTSMMMGKALKFISFFVSRYPKSLYFFSEGFIRFLDRSYKSSHFWKFSFFLIDSWIPGTLTNYKVVRSRLDKLQNRTNLTQCPSGLIFLGESRFLPIASTEARASKFPSIGLSDIDNGFSPFTYTIPSNNKTFGISNAYYQLFKHAAEHGRVLGFESCTDRVNSRFDSLVDQALYLSRFYPPDIGGVRIQTGKSPKPVIQYTSYRRQWLSSLGKFPSETFSYLINFMESKFRPYNRLIDLCIDLSISIQLVGSSKFWEQVEMMDAQFRESGNRRYLRYLNRKWKRRYATRVFR